MEKNRNFLLYKNVDTQVGDWPSICNLVSSFSIQGHSWPQKTPTASNGDWATRQHKKSPFQSHISTQFSAQMSHFFAWPSYFNLPTLLHLRGAWGRVSSFCVGAMEAA
jgi:hypothetical protein